MNQEIHPVPAAVPSSPTSTPPPEGPRYAVRKNFVYGEDVAEWTISTSGLPRYRDGDVPDDEG